MQRVKRWRVHLLAVARWRAADDVFDTRGACHAYAHACRRHQRIFSARDIATNICNGDLFLPEHNAGLGFALKFGECFELPLRELRNLAMTKFEIFLKRLRKRRLGGGNLILGYAKIPALPLI